MLFRQKELLRWLGVSVFEIWVWLLSLTIFSVLLVLKVRIKNSWKCSCICFFSHFKTTTFQVEEQLLPSETSWFIVFSPLFICDGLNAYFCIIVFIRQYLDRLNNEHAKEKKLHSVLEIGFIHRHLLSGLGTLMHFKLSREFRNALLRALWSLFVIGDMIFWATVSSKRRFWCFT